MSSAHKWWVKAVEDYESAIKSYEIKEYNTAAFLCQQSLEKALKALLLHNKNKLRKIHDLVELGNQLNIPKEHFDVLKRLTVAYTSTRYPDILGEKNLKSKIPLFIERTEEILTWVENQILKSSKSSRKK